MRPATRGPAARGPARIRERADAAPTRPAARGPAGAAHTPGPARRPVARVRRDTVGRGDRHGPVRAAHRGPGPDHPPPGRHPTAAGARPARRRGPARQAPPAARGRHPHRPDLRGREPVGAAGRDLLDPPAGGPLLPVRRCGDGPAHYRPARGLRLLDPPPGRDRPRAAPHRLDHAGDPPARRRRHRGGDLPVPPGGPGARRRPARRPGRRAPAHGAARRRPPPGARGRRAPRLRGALPDRHHRPDRGPGGRRRRPRTRRGHRHRQRPRPRRPGRHPQRRQRPPAPPRAG